MASWLKRSANTILLSLIAQGVFMSYAWSNSLWTCGNSVGYLYLVEGGFVPSNDSGWHSDTGSIGTIVLKIENDKPKITIADARGAVFNPEESGARLFLFRKERIISILAIYGADGEAGNIENYTFYPKQGNLGEVLWTQTRYGSGIDKAGVNRAECQFQTDN